MSNYNCLLTLALPSALEEEVCDVLLAHPEWVNGFSVIQAEGFGAGSRLSSTLEQVRGRARRVLVQLVINDSHLDELITLLRAQYPSDEVAWWTAPITAFGRLG